MSNTAMQEQDYEKDVKVDFSIWKRLLSYVFRYKKTAIALMLCNVGIAVIDILYPLMSQYAIDNFVEKGTTAGIGWFIALYIAFIALQALGVYSFIVKAGKLEMNVSYDMRREAFQKLQELSFSFYDRTAVGYLMARMISDVGSLSEMMAWSFVDLLWASTYVIGVVIAMFAMNWKLALLIMIVIPPLAVISVFFQKKILKYQRRVRKTNSRITGAGKSTIVNLVCRFYEPTEGRVLIDGRDYRERSQLWLQSSLGYVLQTPHLFSGTIADNIRYGRKDATDEEVRAAARMVHAEEFILRQDKGYDTEVGEGGVRLSTGEKQLISFARVILADPRIFVLDEATSSIDTETEQLIQDAITTVLDNRTSFIVAHRLSTIRNADRILVIRGGEITEQGTHSELIAKHGYYYDLYTTQFREEASDAILSE